MLAVHRQPPPEQALPAEHMPTDEHMLLLHSPVEALQRAAPQMAEGLELQLGQQYPKESSVVTLLHT